MGFALLGLYLCCFNFSLSSTNGMNYPKQVFSVSFSCCLGEFISVHPVWSWGYCMWNSFMHTDKLSSEMLNQFARHQYF